MKTKVMKFQVTVNADADMTSAEIKEYLRDAIHCWGGQYSDVFGMDPRYRIAKSEPKVSSMVTKKDRPTHTIDVLFDGPPGPVAGRFVEVENMAEQSISIGEWVDRGDGYWALRIPGVTQ